MMACMDGYPECHIMYLTLYIYITSPSLFYIVSHYVSTKKKRKLTEWPAAVPSFSLLFSKQLKRNQKQHTGTP
jgi:hypothetical protein